VNKINDPAHLVRKKFHNLNSKGLMKNAYMYSKELWGSLLIAAIELFGVAHA
jgi:hypothetical protein